MNTVQLRIGSGLNNRTRIESVPEGFVRSAINVDFDSQGKVKARSVPNLIYPGNCHSLWSNYFVEDGDLKYLNADYTSEVVREGVGGNPISYCTTAGRVYFSSGSFCGSIVDGKYRSWGVQRPPRQPDLSTSTGGGMDSGTYHVAITWMRDGEESGTGLSKTISVQAGEGILVSNLPVAGPDIDTVAVYCSSVNGKELYLYREVPVGTDEVFISKHVSNVPLETQFGRTPSGFSIVEAHKGRIYGVRGRYLYRSHIGRNYQNHGLFMPRQHYTFPEDITCLVSLDSALFVGTKKALYKITNLDRDSIPVREKVRDTGVSKILNTVYKKSDGSQSNSVANALSGSTEDIIAYISTSEGFCIVSGSGVQDINHQNFAMDYFENAILGVIDSGGYRKLIGIHRKLLKTNPLKTT